MTLPQPSTPANKVGQRPPDDADYTINGIQHVDTRSSSVCVDAEFRMELQQTSHSYTECNQDSPEDALWWNETMETPSTGVKQAEPEFFGAHTYERSHSPGEAHHSNTDALSIISPMKHPRNVVDRLGYSCSVSSNLSTVVPRVPNNTPISAMSQVSDSTRSSGKSDGVSSSVTDLIQRVRQRVICEGLVEINEDLDGYSGCRVPKEEDKAAQDDEFEDFFQEVNDEIGLDTCRAAADDGLMTATYDEYIPEKVNDRNPGKEHGEEDFCFLVESSRAKQPSITPQADSSFSGFQTVSGKKLSIDSSKLEEVEERLFSQDKVNPVSATKSPDASLPTVPYPKCDDESTLR